MKVTVDLGLCEANAVCMGVVPEVFDLDDNDHLTVLQTLVDTDKEDLTREAARQCPRQAITITD